jgi:hypothetical protein
LSNGFVIGTDLSFPSEPVYAKHIAIWRRILEQLSAETASKLAYENAESLLNRRH